MRLIAVLNVNLIKAQCPVLIRWLSVPGEQYAISSVELLVRDTDQQGPVIFADVNEVRYECRFHRSGSRHMSEVGVRLELSIRLLLIAFPVPRTTGDDLGQREFRGRMDPWPLLLKQRRRSRRRHDIEVVLEGSKPEMLQVFRQKVR